MLKLSVAPTDCTIELTPGVVINARTLTSIDVIAAEAEAGRMMTSAIEGQALAEVMGFGFSFDPDLTDKAIRVGWTKFIIEVLLAEQSIVSWEGIGDENGNPVDPDRRTIAALLQDPSHRSRILSTIQKPLFRLDGEAKK